MIYLIESAAIGKDRSLFLILKIGYTSDKGKDRRFGQYSLHNPGSNVLYEIPDLTIDDEQKIHYHFRNLRYPDYGREWYRYSEEIIDFFRDIEDHDISSLPKSPMSEGRDYKKTKRMVKNIVSEIPIDMPDRKGYVDRIVEDLGSNLVCTDDVLDYIKKDYGQEPVNKYLELLKARESGIYTSDEVINQEVTDFLEKYCTLTTIYDKLKYLCEYGLSEGAVKIVLSQISDSDEIKSCYIALGPPRLKALGYGITKIRKELGIIVFDEKLLFNAIYSEFNEGQKVTLSSAKERLRSIYDSISYKSLPKAKDLEKFFDVRNILIRIEVDGIKKQVKGYELLKRKQ